MKKEATFFPLYVKSGARAAAKGYGRALVGKQPSSYGNHESLRVHAHRPPDPYI
jgi:hypothetical protein